MGYVLRYMHAGLYLDFSIEGIEGDLCCQQPSSWVRWSGSGET